MKMSKKELMERISNEFEDDDERKISILEDMEDSILEDVISDDERKELEELRSKYDDLKRKYTERFLDKAVDKKEEIFEEEKEEKEEIIDVKEI